MSYVYAIVGMIDGVKIPMGVFDSRELAEHTLTGPLEACLKEEGLKLHHIDYITLEMWSMNQILVSDSVTTLASYTTKGSITLDRVMVPVGMEGRSATNPKLHSLMESMDLDS